MIETTGLADPGPILHRLIVTSGLGAALRVDGVVNGPAALGTGFEGVQQVAMADILVLSKTDLMTPSQARWFWARLMSIHPRRGHCCRHARDGCNDQPSSSMALPTRTVRSRKHRLAARGIARQPGGTENRADYTYLIEGWV